mgnify:CR=1 FL=1
MKGIFYSIHKIFDKLTLEQIFAKQLIKCLVCDINRIMIKL